MFRGKILQWRSLQRLGLILILICSLMRFINLDTKTYWYDEVYTSLRLSGYTKIDVFQRIGTEQKDFSSLQIFQCPNNDRNLGHIFNGLITDDSHPPLYFTVLYYWSKMIGCTVTKLRFFSAMLSLLLIPASYLLIKQIFRSSDVALLTTALMVNSPIFLIYAQEARHYSLLTLITLSSSILLLRWLDNGKRIDLGVYSFLTILGLYCHTLYYSVIFGQALYALFTFQLDRFFFKNMLSSFHKNRRLFLSLMISILVFLIWIFRVIQVQSLTIRVGADYTWDEFSISILWQRILLNITSLINDFENPLKSEILTENPMDFSILDLSFNHLLGMMSCSAILLGSLWYTIKYSDRSRTVLLGWLSLPSIVFLTKDLLLGGSASSIIRYQLPSVFGLYACLAFFLVSLFQKTTLKWKKTVVLATIVLILRVQISSNINYLKAPTWWSKYGDYKLHEFADRVTQAQHPLILGEAHYRQMVNLLKLSYVLDPSIPFQLLEEQEIPEATFKNHNVFWVPKV